ncbi:Protein Ric-8A [Intoshia linei]|uniref:Protein Ric-8A n=1 Tax=Intoshia linei TaxID=1819745 RepID=A0A177AZA0_9BILA|nr:Protein Ric-8A [Intoshia linei]
MNYLKKFCIQYSSIDSTIKEIDQKKILDEIKKNVNCQNSLEDENLINLLNCAKILSRNEHQTEFLMDIKLIDKYFDQLLSFTDSQVNCEILKFVYNMVKQSKNFRKIYGLEILENFVSYYSNFNFSNINENSLLRMHIIFFLTCDVSCRNYFQHDIEKYLRLCNLFNDAFASLNYNPSSHSSNEFPISFLSRIKQFCKIITTILYNILNFSKNDKMNVETCQKFYKPIGKMLTIVFNSYVIFNEMDELELKLFLNTINLILCVPIELDSFEKYILPIFYQNSVIHNRINLLLQFLNDKIITKEIYISDDIIPKIVILIKICSKHKEIRKYCRLKIFPYLNKEIDNLPEIGNSMRNKICQLLIKSDRDVKNVVGNLLLVLFKNSVKKIIKYTGYGNAAGFLTNTMFIEKSMQQNKQMCDYSSSSDDSETDYYSNNKDRFNPITGRIEDAKEPPKFVSEEHKAYEAKKLLDAIDKMNRNGIIQTISSEDGKFVPKNVAEMLHNVDPHDIESESD